MLRSAIGIVALNCILLCGCGGSNLTKVSGTVTLDGKPVADAIVSFVPDTGEGPTSVGSTDSSGKYTVACSLGVGVPPGAYSVKIKERAKAAVPDGADPMAGLEPGSPEYIAKYQEMMSGGNQSKNYKAPKKKSGGIPEKYNSGSELKALVEGASQTIDFEMQSK
ncbi:MAG: carboxypeptidase-like regulatory domain-containing protein [Aureliella sp.]